MKTQTNQDFGKGWDHSVSSLFLEEPILLGTYTKQRCSFELYWCKFEEDLQYDGAHFENA